MISTFIILTSTGGLSGFLSSIPNGWWIAIGTFFGSLVLKGYDKWLHRDDSRMAIAKDHRSVVKELNAEIDAAETNEAAWRKQALTCEEDVARLKRFIISQGLEVPE